MDVRMRDVLFAGLFVIVGAAIGPIVTSWLAVTLNTPPVMIDLLPSVDSPQPYDTLITWCASARDSNNDPVEYKFRLKGPSTQYAWQDLQNWSLRNSYTWDTAKLDVGNNTIRVFIRDKKHVMSDVGDAERTVDYTITKNSIDWWKEAVDLDILGDTEGANKAFDEASRLAQIALPSYEKKLDYDRANSSLWYKMGCILFIKGEDRAAMSAYTEATDLDDRFSDAWYGKGNVLYYQGKLDGTTLAYYNEAIKAYDEAILLNPRFSEAYHGKGKALESLGYNSSARIAFARAKELQRNAILR
jgi:tetratricopeptide (TPR) repeat protein